MAMLEVKNLGISFGGLRAVNGFHITIEKNQLYGLIGPNGAGKTTVFNCSPVYTSQMQEVFFWMAKISQGRRTSRSVSLESPAPSRISDCFHR